MLTAAGRVGLAAVACLAYGVSAFSTVQELKGRYGHDDRILVQQGHAAAGVAPPVLARPRDPAP